MTQNESTTNTSVDYHDQKKQKALKTTPEQEAKQIEVDKSASKRYKMDENQDMETDGA